MRGPGRFFNRRLQVWRPVTTDDGYGGQTTVYVQQPGTVRAKVDQPSNADRLLAAQAQSRHDHTVFLLPRADVRRGDELRGTDHLGQAQTFRVLATVQPSTPVYTKAPCQLIQKAGG
ncbi:head-tail adaptor protein [Streptomyces sp. ADI98-10]|uniref:head-tail adaptor protein n=1 Tax=Streptomyces sp. ADI98-10 TaxID=1522763 RepID=UPI000F552E70|nr:head-tail adaptor protein [Streptomyces sp. ADI98-10]RPK85065.1 Phage head-tail joining protein [Streptomyces sp. ADI98-10]